MALLCAGVGADWIRMVGRWRSDELYRYLHVQAQQVMAGLSAAAMLHGVTSSLHGSKQVNPPYLLCQPALIVAH